MLLRPFSAPRRRTELQPGPAARFARATARLSIALCIAVGGIARGAEGPGEPPASEESKPPTAQASVPTPPPVTEPVPDDEFLVASEAVIGEVFIRAANVFDTAKKEENKRVFRWANKLHRITRDSVIANRLLFETGDLYDPRVLEESERLLRVTTYLYDAEIRPVHYAEGRVDILVETRDVWTLEVGAGFRRAGGENRLRVSLQDSNILGSGKDVTIRYLSDVDRTRMTYRYIDPNVLGSWTRLRLDYSDNSDGGARRIDVSRPFYSLESKWAAGIVVGDGERVDPLYTLGEIRDEFVHERRDVRIFAARSAGLVRGRSNRWGVGYAYDEDRFGPLVRKGPPSVLPEDRKLSYPFIQFESIGDGFVEAKDLNLIKRTEDVNLSHRFRASLGWSAPAFGGDYSRLIYSGAYNAAMQPNARTYVIVDAGLSGRYRSGSAENLLLGGAGRYHLRVGRSGAFFARLRVDVASRLDGERQLLLGGDNGLRGYPLRYAEGDRRWLFTVEQRWYSDKQPLRLARIGAAAFFDIGRAWFAGEEDELGTLRDVGVGLRISSSRSSRGAMLHLDVAYPLDGDSSIERLQFLVTTADKF